MGYVGDEVCEEDRPNPNMVPNQWSQAGFHCECHHPECVVIGTVRLYFITEEEYLAHWNAFHAAVSPWYVCPTEGCKFVVPGEPHAFDCYMMHVAFTLTMGKWKDWSGRVARPAKILPTGE